MTTNLPDPILVNLVENANAFEPEPGSDGSSLRVAVTLTVSGLVVGGYLVPDWEWFGELHTSVAQDASDEGGLFDHEAAKLRRLRDEQLSAAGAIKDLPKRYQADLAHSDTPTYIHLVDAQVFTVGGIGVPNPGMAWRGRLSDVSGWALGIFVRASQPS